jgi:uncharacterized protein (UPF0210 family)
MNIRSITYFCDPGWPLDRAVIEKASEFIAAARTDYERAGYTVQTTRLATGPFPHLIPHEDPAALVALAQALEAAGKAAGLDYVAPGPALPGFPNSYAAIPAALAATETAFFAGLMTSTKGSVSLQAVHACAEVIRRIVPLSPDGFANLRFGALANVPPGGPFLPGAYHAGGGPAFALATEAADLAVAAFGAAASLEDARQRLVASLEEQARALSTIAEKLESRYGAAFSGLDLTLAPFPEQSRSLGAALELLGVPGLGRHGSLAAAAFLMDTVEQARYRRTGYNGLMLPTLEDSTLAARAAEGTLTVKDLLMYAAVCGTGLDTVPLPGDTSAGALAAVLLDVAALAQRLDKPLIARLMPVPGKKAGEPTEYDFGYFANSRVLALEAEPLERFFAGKEDFRVRPRQENLS